MDDIEEIVKEIFDILGTVGKLLVAILLGIVGLVLLGIFCYSYGFWGIIGVILVFLLACWVYKDACKRKSEYVLVWTMFTFAFAIIGFPAYLVFRPEELKRKLDDMNQTLPFCPHCGKYYRPPAQFCPHCGSEILGDNRNAKKNRNK